MVCGAWVVWQVQRDPSWDLHLRTIYESELVRGGLA